MIMFEEELKKTILEVKQKLEEKNGNLEDLNYYRNLLAMLESPDIRDDQKEKIMKIWNRDREGEILENTYEDIISKLESYIQNPLVSDSIKKEFSDFIKQFRNRENGGEYLKKLEEKVQEKIWNVYYQLLVSQLDEILETNFYLDKSFIEQLKGDREKLLNPNISFEEKNPIAAYLECNVIKDLKICKHSKR